MWSLKRVSLGEKLALSGSEMNLEQVSIMKRLFLIVILFFSTTWAAVSQVECSPTLKGIYEIVLEVPEVESLVDRILQKGPLQIEMHSHLSNKFEGYWDGENRTIYITKTDSKAAKISTLIFEMHNAAYDDELEKLDSLAKRGEISRPDYIRSVEYWEYQNAKKCAAILDKGIALGLFPKESHWKLSDTFEEHFRIQKKAGHSRHIGRMYDQLQ